MSRRKKNRKRQRERAMARAKKQGQARTDDSFLAQMEAAFEGGKQDAVERGKRGNPRKTKATTAAVAKTASWAGVPTHSGGSMGSNRRDDPYGMETTVDLTGTLPKTVTKEHGVITTRVHTESTATSKASSGYSYSGHTGGSQTGNRGAVGITPPKPVHAGKIMCRTPAGAYDGPYTVSMANRDWWEEACKHYTPNEDGVIVIPIDRATFSYGAVRFNACVFNATEDYLKARWGRALHATDRDWLAEHPLSTDDGVPQEYTAITIQGMLEPYGLGVSRMRVRAGTLSAGDALRQFMDALGCNPFALVDRQTSNAEAAEKLGMDLVTANNLWRFEFHTEPLGCSIVGERGWTNNQGVQTGTFGGHARYLAPRAKGGDWFVSIQLAPMEQIEYMLPIVLPEYKPRRGEATLQLSSIKQPGSERPVATLYKGSFYAPEEADRRKAEDAAKAAAPKPSTPAASGGTAGSSQLSLEDQRWLNEHAPTVKPPERGFQTVEDLLSQNSRAAAADVTGADDVPEWGRSSTDGVTDDVLEAADEEELTLQRQNDLRMQYLWEEGVDLSINCQFCGEATDVYSLSRGTEICTTCYDAYWHNLFCSKCTKHFDGTFTPWFVERNPQAGAAGKAFFECPNPTCSAIIAVDLAEHKATYPGLVELAEACPEMDGEEFLETLLDACEEASLELTDADDRRPADQDRWPSEWDAIA